MEKLLCVTAVRYEADTWEAHFAGYFSHQDLFLLNQEGFVTIKIVKSKLIADEPRIDLLGLIKKPSLIFNRIIDIGISNKEFFIDISHPERGWNDEEN